MSNVSNNGINNIQGVTNTQKNNDPKPSEKPAAKASGNTGNSSLGALGQVLVSNAIENNGKVNREGVSKLFDALTLASTAVDISGDGKAGELLYEQLLAA